MIHQIEITLTPKSRGFHLVTSKILSQLPKLPKTGIINIPLGYADDELKEKKRKAINEIVK